MSELLDTFAADGTPLGPRPREEVHRLGLWHRTWHCWVVARRPAGLHVVLQRRAAGKPEHPGLLDVAAAGHLAAGEAPRDGVRELEEELGVTPAPGALLALGVRRDVLRGDDPTHPRDDRELVHEHVLVDDRPLAGYAPDPVEVGGVAELPATAFARLLRGEDEVAEGCELAVGAGAAAPVAVRLGDLVPREPALWLDVLGRVVAAAGGALSPRA